MDINNRDRLDLRVGDIVKIINVGIFCGNTNNLNGKTITISYINKKGISTNNSVDFKSKEGPFGYLHHSDRNSFWKYFKLIKGVPEKLNYEVYE